jgi:hypothetical protein
VFLSSFISGEFQPDGEWSDDEETIEREEEQVKPTEQEREIEMLQKESELSLDDILDQLPPGYLEQRAKDIEVRKDKRWIVKVEQSCVCNVM